MTDFKQRDLFIQSDILCKCDGVRHALTFAEFIENINQIRRIKQLVLDNGWDLSLIYYRYLDPLDHDCNAWKIGNSRYLAMRGNFTEEIKQATIPLERNRH